jgi:hypothetical protein
MYTARIPILRQIEARRNSRAILFVTGDRPGLETQIHPEVYDYFVNLLDNIGVTQRISLIIYTRGGSTLAARSLVNLIHQFCEDFDVIAPSKAHSAGTLIALGAQHIFMTKQATLGPIDPSVNTPLNPQIPGGPPDARLPVSVEAVNGFIELCKAHISEGDSASMNSVLTQLAATIHPLVLGEVYRSKAQIQMLAKEHLERAAVPHENIEQIVSFLCSDSGSHDYTIHRREARRLGLQVEKPDQPFYEVIKALYDDFATELMLTDRWDPIRAIGVNPVLNYTNKRCLIESTTGGSYFFATEGVFLQHITPNAPTQYQDNRTYEGWRYEPTPAIP